NMAMQLPLGASLPAGGFLQHVGDLSQPAPLRIAYRVDVLGVQEPCQQQTDVVDKWRIGNTETRGKYELGDTRKEAANVFAPTMVRQGGVSSHKSSRPAYSMAPRAGNACS